MNEAIKFSMSTLFIEDSQNQETAERKLIHSRQGFSKTASCIQCDMLGDWGVVNVHYSELPISYMDKSERILALPFYTPSKTCKISSPDYSAFEFNLSGEHFRLTIGQSLLKESNGPDPAEVELLLYFETVLDSSIVKSKILKFDAALDPPETLL